MNDDQIRILVNFPQTAVMQVSIADNGLQLSKRAIENAMAAIGWVANKATATLDQLDQRPDEAEVEFGIKVDAEAGILMGSTSTEAHIKVRLVWKNVKA